MPPQDKTLEALLHSVVRISNILHIDDPDSGWGGHYRERVLPDECECCVDLVNEVYDDDYKCSCPEEKYIAEPPRRTTVWEVVLLDKGSAIIGKGEGQSQESAEWSAVADAVARWFNNDREDV